MIYCLLCPAPDTFQEEVIEAVKAAIRASAEEKLRVHSPELGPSLLGFRFIEPDELDEPLSLLDIVVIAHSYQARTAMADSIAGTMGESAAGALELYYNETADPITFTVTALLGGAIGFYQGSVEGRPVNLSWR